FLPFSHFIPTITHLPSLHSFPTRRSSDLQPRRSYPDFASQLPATGRLGTGWLARFGRELHFFRPSSGEKSARPVRPPCASEASKDRKSTRLNSSHEWISYAVFCLKKKKNR